MSRTFGSVTIHPPRNGRYRAWQAMRIMRRFTIPDIAATADISISSATKYISALLAAGYLRIVLAKRTGVAGGYPVYAMIRNSGPRHPVIRSCGIVFDPNTGEEVQP